MHFLLFQFLSGLWRNPTFDIQGLVYFLIADFEFAFFALMITHPAAYLSSLLFLTAIFRTSSNEAPIRTLLLCLDPAGGILRLWLLRQSTRPNTTQRLQLYQIVLWILPMTFQIRGEEDLPRSADFAFPRHRCRAFNSVRLRIIIHIRLINYRMSI